MARKSTIFSLLVLFISQMIFNICGVSQAQFRGLTFKNLDSLNNEIKYENKYAILIGVDNYDPKSGFPALKYATNDAIAIKNILIKKAGYLQQNIKILLNKEATRRNILNSFALLFKDNIPENSQLLVFFAGHGTTIGKNGTKKRGFLVPIDGRDDELSATAIGMDEIGQQVDFLKPKHVLFLVDACYGGLAQSRGPTSTNLTSKAFIKNVWGQKGREIITAGSADETVLEADDWQHSAFTKVLIDAIEKEEADTNNDGILVTSELYGYIQQRVPYYAQSKGGKQTPQLNTFTPEVGTFLLELSKNALSKGKINELIPLENEIKRKLNSHILINSNISNAFLKINDLDIGFIIPNNYDLEIAPGYYKLELSGDKYFSQVKPIEIKPDTISKVDFNLIKKIFNLEIQAIPNDALVFVNDKILGRGNQNIELEKGRHSINIEKPGYISKNIIIDLLGDSLIVGKLDDIKAMIELNTNPSLANIRVKGIEIGKSPYTFELLYGSHEIEIWKDDFFSKKYKLEIKEPVKIIQNINLDLNPNGKMAINMITDYWNKKLITNVGISSLSLLSFLYFNKTFNENNQNTTFLNISASQKRGNLLQTAKYASALFGSFEILNSLYCLKKVIINSNKKMSNFTVSLNGGFKTTPILLCLKF